MARLILGNDTIDATVEANPDPPRNLRLPLSANLGHRAEFDLLAIETRLDGAKVAVYVKHEPGVMP